jgi:dTDP-4-amino-4,6-dideoxygalactose transaminase
MPLLNQPAYRKIFGDIEKKYPVARWIDRNGFYIGCHQHLSGKDLEYIVSVFGKFFAGRKGKNL